MSVTAPLVVGIGGSPRQGSSSELALRECLGVAEALGARTECFAGVAIDLPMYAPGERARSDAADALVDAVRRADGVVIAAPGYHGAISGLAKNALDYIEDLRDDERPYLDGRAVACISVAAGPQAAVGTLIGLRAVVHALRGWPTPLGVPVNSQLVEFGADGSCRDQAVAGQLRAACEQVLDFARMKRTAEQVADGSVR
ncbi:MAG: NAD(P)H-dependent oxidoreductase [Actinobacteria bacterium]|nr:NAD(P)H-dependent oxidoreductase [Actinomycetota bacterium]